MKFRSLTATQYSPGEDDRAELKGFEREQTEKFEALAKKFKTLELSSEEKHNNLLNQVQTEQTEKTKLKSEHEKLIRETNEKLECISRQCEAKEKSILSITEDMKLVEEKLGILRVEHAFLQEQHQQLQSNHTELDRKYSSKCNDLDNSKDMIEELEKVVNETSTKLHKVQSAKENLEKHISDTEATYASKLTNLTSEYNSLKMWAETEGERLKELEGALCQCEQSLEETKCSKDMLLLERSEMQGELKQCKDTEVSMTKTIAEKEKQVSQLKLGISQNQSEIDELLITKKGLEDEMERLQKDLEEALEEGKMAQETIDDMNKRFETQSNESSTTAEKLRKSEKDNKSFLKKQASLEKEIKSVKDDLQKSRNEGERFQKQVKELEESLKETQEKLQKVEEDQNTTSSKLEDEVSNVTSLQKELEDKENDISTLDDKNKAMKIEITTKNKQIKDLEKEIRSLKGKLIAKEKADMKMGEAHNNLRDELMSLRNEAEQLKIRLREQEEKNEELEKTVQGLEKDVRTAEEDNETYVKEKEAAKKLHDSEVAKMVNLLEEYKIKNQKTVQDKQKEIENVLKVSKDQEQKQKEQKEKLDMEVSKLKEVQDALTEKDEELKNVREKCVKQEERIVELGNEVKSLKRDQKNVTKQEKELSKAKETLAKQKSQIKDLEKVSKELKAKEKALTDQEKNLTEAEDKCEAQAKEILRLKKELEEVDELKKRESEVEFLRKEIEQLKVASAKASETAKSVRSSMDKTGDTTPKGKSWKPSKLPVKTSKQASGKENLSEQASVKKTELPPAVLRTPAMSATSSPRAIGTVTPVAQTGRNGSYGESLFKRRKVMFCDLQPGDEVGTQSDSDQSSTSELMEIDASQMVLQSRTGKQTPLHIKPSPRVRQSPGENISTNKMSLLLPVQRGAPSVKKKKPVPKDTTNVRKTPTAGKSTNKFFKASPGVRKSGMTMGRKPAKKMSEELSWFDNDAVFGFDNED